MTGLERRRAMMGLSRKKPAMWDGTFYFITDIIIPYDAIIEFRLSIYEEQGNWDGAKNNRVFFASDGTYSVGFLCGGASGSTPLAVQPLPYYQSKTYSSWGDMAKPSRSYDIMMKRGGYNINGEERIYTNGVPNDVHVDDYLQVGGYNGNNMNKCNLEYLKIYDSENQMLHNISLVGYIGTPKLYDEVTNKEYSPIFIQ